jgi:hypothetical protein
VDAGRRLDRRIQSSRWIARRKRDDRMAYATACFGFEYLDADWGSNAALNHTEDLSMNELAGTARVPRDSTQHHRWRGPLSDSQGLPWACPRVLAAARAAFVR